MDKQQELKGATSTNPSIAVITPSFKPDFERCRLLAETLLQHVPENVHHYLLVDRCDKALFSTLESSRTHIVLTQDILPWWLIQLKFNRKWWINLRGMPVRGWILQQLAKLSVNRAVPADVYLFLDSDTFFVRDYDPYASIKEGKVPLFRQQKEEVRVPWNTRWHQVAARLLGLPVHESYNTSYVGNAIYWKRENLERMQAQVEKVTGRSWIVSVARQLHMSEYVLYGMFTEHVLGEASGQYFSPIDESLNHWTVDFLDEVGLRELKAKLEPQVAIVMISAKARIPAAVIRRVFL